MSHKFPTRQTSGMPIAMLFCGIATAVLSLDAHSADRAEPDDPIVAWVRDKELVLGGNPNAKVFVARGDGRDRLECLVSSLGELTRFMGCDVTATEEVANGNVTASLATVRTAHRLRGYDIEHESVLSERDKQEYESVTVVKKDGALLCALYSRRNDAEATDAFYPTLAKSRREAVENELMKAFVKDFFVHRTEERNVMKSVSVIDCSPQRKAAEEP